MLRGPSGGAGDALGSEMWKCESIDPDAEQCVSRSSRMVREPGRRIARENRRQRFMRFEERRDLQQCKNHRIGQLGGLRRHSHRLSGNNAAGDGLGSIGLGCRILATAGRLVFHGAARANRHNRTGSHIGRTKERAPGMHGDRDDKYPADHVQSLSGA